jgi:NADH dehydrogenase (ubiquinone) Fe-S protein 4
MARARAQSDGEVGVTSGLAERGIYAQRVTIYSPARTASQQGTSRKGEWRIWFTESEKWENPLQGWNSTADPQTNGQMANLYFDSLDAAQRFCHKHGLQYDVRYPKNCVGANGVATIPSGQSRNARRPKGYGDNFSVTRKGIPDVSSMDPRPTPPDEAVAYVQERKQEQLEQQEQLEVSSPDST